MDRLDQTLSEMTPKRQFETLIKMGEHLRKAYSGALKSGSFINLWALERWVSEIQKRLGELRRGMEKP